MTVALIISVANAGTSFKHQRSKRSEQNQCLANPCQNGGNLNNNNECITCTCADGWAGPRCDKALSNLALKKPATQSSTYISRGVTFSAKFAVDGHNGTDLFEDKCSHTLDGDTNPWWLVDLNEVYSIKSVRIFNRGNTEVADRLRDVNVTVGLTESDVNTPCGFFAGPGTQSQVVNIDCSSSPKGRFVKISTPIEDLTLCEVEVFGYSA